MANCVYSVMYRTIVHVYCLPAFGNVLIKRVRALQLYNAELDFDVSTPKIIYRSIVNFVIMQ